MHGCMKPPPPSSSTCIQIKLYSCTDYRTAVACTVVQQAVFCRHSELPGARTRHVPPTRPALLCARGVGRTRLSAPDLWANPCPTRDVEWSRCPYVRVARARRSALRQCLPIQIHTLPSRPCCVLRRLTSDTVFGNVRHEPYGVWYSALAC